GAGWGAGPWDGAAGGQGAGGGGVVPGGGGGGGAAPGHCRPVRVGADGETPGAAGTSGPVPAPAGPPPSGAGGPTPSGGAAGPGSWAETTVGVGHPPGPVGASAPPPVAPPGPAAAPSASASSQRWESSFQYRGPPVIASPSSRSPPASHAEQPRDGGGRGQHRRQGLGVRQERPHPAAAALAHRAGAVDLVLGVRQRLVQLCGLLTLPHPGQIRPQIADGPQKFPGGRVGPARNAVVALGVGVAA